MPDRKNNAIITAEALAGKSLQDFDKDDFIRHFFSDISLSTRAFYDRRNIASDYLSEINAFTAIEELGDVMYRDLGYNATFKTNFFRDLDDLIDELERRLSKLSVRVDRSVFASQAAALILAWMGVPPQSAIEIKKTHIDHEMGTLFANDRIYRMPSAGAHYITEYAKNDTFIKENNKGVCVMTLKNSEYLFRTFKTSRVSLHMFNSSIPRKLNVVDGKQFFYADVLASGIFYRAHQYEMVCGPLSAPKRIQTDEGKREVLEKISKAFEQDITNRRLLSETLRQYRAYKRFFKLK